MSAGTDTTRNGVDAESPAAARGRDRLHGVDGPMARVGPIGRLGRYTATHFRVVLIAWLLVAVVLGFFAPASRQPCPAPVGRPPARSRCRRGS